MTYARFTRYRGSGGYNLKRIVQTKDIREMLRVSTMDRILRTAYDYRKDDSMEVFSTIGLLFDILSVNAFNNAGRMQLSNDVHFLYLSTKQGSLRIGTSGH